MRGSFIALIAVASATAFCACASYMETAVGALPPAGDRIIVSSFEAGNATVHLIRTREGAVLVDTGWPGHEKKILEEISRIGVPLELIFITHAHIDHYGNAAAIRAATGAPIAIHVADADDMSNGRTLLPEARSWGIFGKAFLPIAERLNPPPPTVPDTLVSDGSILQAGGLQMRVLHVPGHTVGSCCLVVDSGTDGAGPLVFAGDLVASKPSLMAQRYFASDYSQIPSSMETLKALSPSKVFPGHGMPFPGERLDELRPRYGVPQ